MKDLKNIFVEPEENQASAPFSELRSSKLS